MSKRDSLGRVLKAVAGIAVAAAGVMQVLSKRGQMDISDLDCDWVCDNCGAELNFQPGFRAGGTWVCKSCGYENDVSTDNIIPTRRVTDDQGNELDILDMPEPWYDTDPEDY